MWIWLFFIALVVLETWADFFTKKYAMDPSVSFFIYALFLYCVANASWLISMQLGMKLSKGVVLFGIAQAITGVLVGLYMGETLSTRNWVGIGIGCIAIGLLLQD